MPSEVPEGGERTRRLHPASLVFTVAALVRTYLIPAVLFLFFAQGGNWQRWLIFPFVAVLLTELVKYFTLSYRLTPTELVIRSGLFSRTERHIPFERVQNVELVESALHRLIDVAEVRLQTGSGAEVEAHLRVVSKAAVDELRRAILAARAGERTGAEPDEPSVTVLRLPLSEVALHGLITGRGLLLLAALFGLFMEFSLDWDDYESFFVGHFVRDEELAKQGQVFERMWTEAVERSFGSILGWTALFVPVLVGLRLLAAAWAVVRLYDFTLERTGDGLQSRYGLLTRLSATIPRARVQVLSVQEGIWHRLLRRSSVQVDTAGGFKREQGQLGSQWVAPIVRQEALLPLVREVQPDAEIDPPGWQPVHPRAFTRMVRVELVLLLILSATVAYIFGPWIVLPALLLAALAVWHARLTTRRLAVALTPTSIVTRTGAFAHRRSLARFSRIQSVSCRRSFLDRRWGMATISVDTAGGAVQHRIVVPFLDAARAQEIYGRLREQVARAVSAGSLESDDAKLPVHPEP